MSKIYERGLCTEINKYFDPTLSKYQLGSGKGYNAQQCLLTMLEKWRASVDQNETCSALLVDLYIAFDCLLHDLLIGKLRAYGCDLPSLKLINWYLRNRHHNDPLESRKDLSWVPYFLISFVAI